MEKIAVLGAGAYGTALGGVLAEKGFSIEYYDPIIKESSLSKAVSDAAMMLLAVPSGAVSHLLPHLPKEVTLIIATKGILTPNYFSDFRDYMIISGPGFAEDIKDHKKTKLTATDQRIVKMFETQYLNFDYTDDKIGVLMCGALKNVYAIKAGLLNLLPKTKAHADFLNKAAREMKMVLSENNAKAATVDLACGQGDLKITCYLPSRNYEFGQKLSQNAQYRSDKTVEGVSALKRIRRGEIKIPQTAAILRELMEESKEWG